MSSPLPDQLRPQPVEVPFGYHGEGRMRFLSPTLVEARIILDVFRVEYEILARLSSDDPARDYLWTLEHLEGRRTDGQGGLSRAAYDELSGQLPWKMRGWYSTIPPGALERVRGEQLLVDPEQTAELVRELDARIAETLDGLEEKAEQDRVRAVQRCEEWRASLEERCRNHLRSTEESIQRRNDRAREEADLLQQTRDEIVRRFTEANTL